MTQKRNDGASMPSRIFDFDRFNLTLTVLPFRIQAINSKIEDSLKRGKKLKVEKQEKVREHLHNQRMRFESQAKKQLDLHAARNVEMNKMFSVKFELAALRKKLIEMKAKNDRMEKVRS